MTAGRARRRLPPLLLTTVLSVLLGCEGGPPQPDGPQPEADAAGSHAVSGVSSRAPLSASPAASPLGADAGLDIKTGLDLVADDGWLEAQLARLPGRFERWLASAAEHRLQILVTVVDGPERRLRRHGYRVDAEYVYPASSVKPFLALASLLTLRRLAADGGAALGPETPLAPCQPSGKRCPLIGDPSNLSGGAITVGHEIRKLLLVSDNDAFARLYDLVGQLELNQMLWQLGFPSVRIHHRMGESAEAGKRTAGVDLLPEGGERVHVPARFNEAALRPTPAARLEVGRAHVDAQGSLQQQPMSFAHKNYVSLTDLQRLLVALVLVDHPQAPELGLATADRERLVAAMTQAPSESLNPRYRAAEHPVDGQKPLLAGVRAVLDASRIRHLGKSGHAYGFQVVNAYLEDRQSGRALFVTAAIHVNPNGIVNDDRYDYDGSTRPFMRDLGEALARAVLAEPERKSAH